MTENRDDLIEKVRSLLVEAKRIHIDYERDALGGAYDEEWAKWYAEFLLDNGLATLLSKQGAPDLDNLDVNRLARLLSQADEEHRANAPDQEWQLYYARFLVNVITQA